MITAVDSSVLWTVFNDEPGAVDWSRALLDASREGELTVCDVVFAEIAPAFDSRQQALDMLQRLGVRFDPLNDDAAFEAGCVFKAYRQEGGPRRSPSWSPSLPGWIRKMSQRSLFREGWPPCRPIFGFVLVPAQGERNFHPPWQISHSE